MTSVPQQLFTTSVLNMLRRGLNRSVQAGTNGVYLNTGPGPKVYDHEVPGDATDRYYLLQQLPGGSYTGPPLGDPSVDVALVFQVDAVGRRRDQVQYMADDVYAVVMSRWTDEEGGTAWIYAINLPVGWVVCGRLATDTPPGVLRDVSALSSLYSVPQRFTIVFTPA